MNSNTRLSIKRDERLMAETRPEQKSVTFTIAQHDGQAASCCQIMVVGEGAIDINDRVSLQNHKWTDETGQECCRTDLVVKPFNGRIILSDRQETDDELAS